MRKNQSEFIKMFVKNKNLTDFNMGQIQKENERLSKELAVLQQKDKEYEDFKKKIFDPAESKTNEVLENYERTAG